MSDYYFHTATMKERTFFRKVGKPGYAFYTVKNSQPNWVQKVTDRYIYIRTQKSSKELKIPRQSLRRAIAFLYFRRIVTLKQLNKIHSFSSALAAMLKAIMIDLCKVATTKSGTVRLSLRGLRYFFSGVSRGKDDVRIVKKYGGRFVLLNYFMIRNDPLESWRTNLLANGFHSKCVFLDPGEKTLYEARQNGKNPKPIDAEEYAAFVRRHSDLILHYLTIDKIGDPEITKRNTVLLEELTGKKPVPVYHIQSPLDVLQSLIDEEHEIIAIGGSALRSVSLKKRKQAFDAIFERFGETANFHALGLGSLQFLLNYPWFSADASSWLNGRIFGKIIALTGDYKTIRSIPPEEALGFNVRTYSALEERYTKLQIDWSMFPQLG
ncbi:hypothetical protein YDYSY3_38090 [Paenibacillus chitinolyticus]|uniref:hypothetical protein n=1 Tax=Paenibacillus chitinolyticus TaxID=79263 RepID=UPI0026E4E8EF|nr:hypothetical protein [Paenibacillus chitinolyticus]GKS12809.1 hypothetical protein YDYSY3_38090 [Paenibacillus chitinolyticus]